MSLSQYSNLSKYLLVI